MATELFKSQYIKYDGKASVSPDNLFVEVKGRDDKVTLVPITSLYVKLDKKTYNAKTRKVVSYSDFVAHAKKNNVFTSATAMQTVKNLEVKVKGFDIPKNFTTISEDSATDSTGTKLPFGIKRMISLQEKPSTIALSDELRVLVVIDGKQQFIKTKEIYYYNDGNQKSFIKRHEDFSRNAGETFYTKDGKAIQMIYTEKQYIYDEVIAADSVDFSKKLKTSFEFVDKVDKDLEELIKHEVAEQEAGRKPKSKNFEVEHNGVRYNIRLDESNKFVHAVKYTTKPIVKYFSEQEYVEFEEPDPDNPKKNIKTSRIKVRNFEIKSNGEYYQVTINGRPNMVKLADLVDEHGNAIQDLRTMIGKEVQIKVSEGEFKQCDPVTHEQAHLTYSTIKTFQEITYPDGISEEDKVTEDTYLRLKNGSYVKELETVQPKAYKVVNESDESFDAFVVETLASDGSKKFVIVPPNYFERHGDSPALSRAKAHRIKRCRVDDPECSVVQTTSKGQEIEQCSIVKKTNFCENIESNALETACQGFLTAYKQGQYQISDVYQNDSLEELSVRGKRYEYTDVSYLPDYANELNQYRSLNTKDLMLKNGKLVGGPKYSIWKGIKNGYGELGKGFLATYKFALAAGIFIPVVGPIIGAAQVLITAAAIPLIPIANIAYGVVKNHLRSKFIDKNEINRKQLIKDLEARIQLLYERQTSKDVNPYSEARFEDEYAKLVNDIISLSAANVNNNLVVKDGVASVTTSNASAVKAYMQEFNAVAKRLSKVEKKFAKSKLKFEELDKQIKYYENEELNIPAHLLATYEKAKQEYEAYSTEYAELKAKQDSLMNYTGNPVSLEHDQECDRLLTMARTMRTAVYLKTFKDNAIVHEALYGKGGPLNNEDMLTASEIVGYDITVDDLGLTEEELENLTEEEIEELIQAKKDAQIRPEDLMLDVDGKLIKRKEDKELLKQFDEAEDKVAFIRGLETDKAAKMIERMSFDTKNGIILDGRVVGFDDEDVSRTPDYSKGYHWAKIKQALQLVHDGIRLEEQTFTVRVNPVEADSMSPNPYAAEPNPDVVEPVVTPAPRKKKGNAKDIAAEQAVVFALEEKEANSLYKKLMGTLTRKNGKFKMRKEDAGLFIFNFTSQISQAHAQNLSAKMVFEKDSIEDKILRAAVREIVSLATQNVGE